MDDLRVIILTALRRTFGFAIAFAVTVRDLSAPRGNNVQWQAAGGRAVDLTWTDGPTEAEVCRVIDAIPRDRAEDADPYLFTTRKYSAETMRDLVERYHDGITWYADRHNKRRLPHAPRPQYETVATSEGMAVYIANYGEVADIYAEGLDMHTYYLAEACHRSLVTIASSPAARLPGDAPCVQQPT